MPRPNAYLYKSLSGTVVMTDEPGADSFMSSPAYKNFCSVM